jgi:hypothetical protein
MTWRVWFWLSVALAVLAGPALAQDRPETIDLKEVPFHVRLPPGFHVERRMGPDFDVYYFNRGDKTFVGAYIGFAPGFPTKYVGEGMERRPEGRLQQVVSCSGSDVMRRDVLFVMNPGFVHAWRLAVSAAERTEADAILLSIGFDDWPTPLTAAQLKRCP